MTTENVSTAFQNYCTSIVEKYQIPGYSIGLAKDGEALWNEGYGYRDKEEKLPVSDDTVFGIGSVTKVFTCVAIMQLQEQGKLSVHDLVTKHLPEFKTPNPEWTDLMTIHHFMTHSAGIPPIATLNVALKAGIDQDPKIDYLEQKKKELEQKEDKEDKDEKPDVSVDTYEDLLQYLEDQTYELLGEPGTEFSYSNDGYALLGAIIERVSGESYESFMKKSILDPCDMTNSVFHLEELNEHDNVAILYNSYVKDEETIVYRSNNPWDAPSMRAAGFLKSTVKDMLKFTEIFRNHGLVGKEQILSSESVEQMTTPHIECGMNQYYGYGVMIMPDFFGHKLVEHGGAIKGVAAQMSTIPELGLTGMAFSNLGGVPTSHLLHGAFAEYVGQQIDASPLKYKVKEVAEKTLEEYEGEYHSGEGAVLTLKIVDGTLTISSADTPKVKLKPINEDQFIMNFRENKMGIRFRRDKKGSIVRIAFGYRQIPKVTKKVEE